MILSKTAIRQIKESTTQVKGFAQWFIGIVLRPYQIEAANAIVKSVFARDGESFVLIFSRQSGKDETIAITLLFLMFRFIDWGIDMICAQPTFKPQTINAMERIKKRGYNFGRRLSRTAGYIVRLGAARTSYFSTDPTANTVGATGRLLIANEAQDINIAIWDGKFIPMGANENATRVYSGTRWTADTLLERELKIALEKEKKDGKRRVFMYDATQVRKINPFYGRYVDAEVKKLGRQHPLIKSQYFNELIDAQAGMFNTARRALMIGDPKRAHTAPIPGRIYAIQIDVAGTDEALLNLDGMGNPGRDSTAYTITDVDLSELPTLQAPIYHAIKRESWQGLSQVTAFGRLCQIIDLWKPIYIVVDATGVGEGLWTMLFKKYGARVLPFKFTQQSKSELGWGYLAIIETGRFRDCCPTEEVREQYDKCQSEILPGPGKTMRWGVKDGTRGRDGLLIHDEYIITDALTAELDKLTWNISAPALMTEAHDPLAEMDGNF
jgi:hypothetical protein